MISVVALILVWILFGGVIGMLARAIFPDGQSTGWVGTVCLGVVGSFLGGLLANVLVGGGEPFAMHAAGWIGGVLGAVVALTLLSMVRPTSLSH